MLKNIRIAAKKIRRLPRSAFGPRLRLGIRKYLRDYPYFISIQTVSACNLKCKHCFINDYRTAIPDGVTRIMKLAEFSRFAERLEDMIRRAYFLNFSTFEAILNKDLFRMMDLVLEINPRIRFPFLSNTMELDREKIERLLEYPVSEINISLDGYTKKTVEDFKTGVKFEQIVETIHELAKTPFRDRIAVTFVAHRNNIAELPEYVEFVHRLGVRQIYVSNVLSFTRELEHLALYGPEGNSQAENIFGEAVRIAKKNRQSISMPRLRPELMGCQAVETFFVDITGYVSPCDFLAVSTPFTLGGETVQHPPVRFGNIFEKDPISIYRDPAFKAFRDAHRLGKKLPSQCTHCIDAYGLMCSNRIHHTA